MRALFFSGLSPHSAPYKSSAYVNSEMKQLLPPCLKHSFAYAVFLKKDENAYVCVQKILHGYSEKALTSSASSLTVRLA